MAVTAVSGSSAAPRGSLAGPGTPCGGPVGPGPGPGCGRAGPGLRAQSTGSLQSGDSGVVRTSDSAVLFLLSSLPYTGPKLYKEPSAKSNKHIIQNALAHCCLAGKVNEGQKKKILEVSVRRGPSPGEGPASQRRVTGPELALDRLDLVHFQMGFWTQVRIKNRKSAPCPDSRVHVS